jgi:hypothetical protein
MESFLSEARKTEIFNFLNGTPAVQQLRDSIDKWDFIKLKSFCSTKEMVSKLQRTPTEWEKIFASYTSKD